MLRSHTGDKVVHRPGKLLRPFQRKPLRKFDYFSEWHYSVAFLGQVRQAKHDNRRHWLALWNIGSLVTWLLNRISLNEAGWFLMTLYSGVHAHASITCTVTIRVKVKDKCPVRLGLIYYPWLWDSRAFIPYLFPIYSLKDLERASSLSNKLEQPAFPIFLLASTTRFFPILRLLFEQRRNLSHLTFLWSIWRVA